MEFCGFPKIFRPEKMTLRINQMQNLLKFRDFLFYFQKFFFRLKIILNFFPSTVNFYSEVKLKFEKQSYPLFVDVLAQDFMNLEINKSF